MCGISGYIGRKSAAPIVLEGLSKRLTQRYGDGWSYSNTQNLTLSWSHYQVLMRIKNADERRFYEIEAK